MCGVALGIFGDSERDFAFGPPNRHPSATRVNQENRIKLMLAVAKERLTTKADPAPVTAEELAGGAPQVETQVPAML